MLRARAASDYTSYTINSNSSGSTKYDWIYLKVDPTAANNPAADASDVTSIYTSRSSNNSTDDGSPPTYGLLLAIVTVANGASSITNGNITDKRFNTSIGAQNGSLIVTQQSTGTDAIIQAAGIDANVNLSLMPKGTGAIKGIFKYGYNPYKFSVYRHATQNTGSSGLTVILFDTKEYDTSSNVDITTNKGRFTAPIAGFYRFAARVDATIGTNQRLFVTLYKNGVEVKRGDDITSPGTAVIGSTVAATLQLAANDYVEVYVYYSTSAVAIGTDGVSNYFQGELVSAT